MYDEVSEFHYSFNLNLILTAPLPSPAPTFESDKVFKFNDKMRFPGLNDFSTPALAIPEVKPFGSGNMKLLEVWGFLSSFYG
jgi:hypothetical protein